MQAAPAKQHLPTIPLVDLRAHHDPLRAELEAAIKMVLDESSFIQGKHAASFEQSFASFLDVKHCIGVGNGTDALFIALSAMGIGAGDEVITVANSFIATSEAVTRTGARVKFVDCHPQTYCMDPESVKRSIGARTRAIIPVHLYGHPVDMDPLMRLAQEHGLFVLEDAAQAHGAKYKGRSAGTIGHCGCFSFYPGKNLGALGDAGAVVTNDNELATKMRMFANHGRKDKYDHEFEGINSRLDGIQAAALSVKLKHLARWNERRRVVAARYDRALRDVCAVPVVGTDVEHAYHLYVIRVPHRDEVRHLLQQRGVEAGVHYPIPLPMLRAYRYLNNHVEDFPVACGLKDEILSLPIHGEMTDAQVEHVIESVIQVLTQVRAMALARHNVAA